MPPNVVHVLVTLIQIYSFMILARIILSWLPNLDRNNPLVQFLIQTTEPVLEPARRIVPPLGTIDISPILVFVLLRLLQSALLNSVG